MDTSSQDVPKSPSDGDTAQPSVLTVKEQNALIAKHEGDLLSQGALITEQKTKISEQDAIIADMAAEVISEQDAIIADMAAEVTDQETALSQRDAEIAELKKQLELEREQNLENTQRIKVMMENGHPPSQPTPTAQADTEAVAELRQELQRSKDWVQHLNRVINALGAKLAERDTHIAKQNEEIAKLDIEFEKLGTQIWQLKENKQEMEHILELINANAKKTEEKLTILTMLQFCRDVEDKK